MQEEEVKHGSNKLYLIVGIFLAIILVAGVTYILAGRNKESQSLQSGTSSATISNSTADNTEGAVSGVETAQMPSATVSGDKQMEKVTELQIEDEVIGTGEEAVAGKKITVNYKGTLTDGTQFDSSYDRGTPFSFNLGAGEVIEGWDKGFEGMKVGGKRKLTIPSSMGYGDSGIPGAIPGGATLIFEVELLGVN